MSNFFSSGSEAVDKMGKMHLSGNVTPQIWYQVLKTEKGKPYYLAASILADIVYWYRPMEIRDEYTGAVIGWKKRFKYDMLQRNYAEMETMFEEGKKTLQRALQTLEMLGLIKRHFRKMEFENGIVLHNVMFIELFPERVYEITYPTEDMVDRNRQSEWREEFCRVVKITEEKNSKSDNSTDDSPEAVVVKVERATTVNHAAPRNHASRNKTAQKGMDKSDHIPVPISPYMQGDYPEGMDKSDHTHVDESDHIHGQDWPAPQKEMTVASDDSDQTNTKNTTENTTGITPSINPSGIEDINGIIPLTRYDRFDGGKKQDINRSAAQYMDIIRENIAYDTLMENPEWEYYDLYEELFCIICDVVCVPREKIRVGKEDYPYQLVKSRFLKLNSQHLMYVIWCMEKATEKIQNIRAYLITALYNAPSTHKHYFMAEVNHYENNRQA